MMLCITLTASAQVPVLTGVLTGHVLDTAGRPVIGATVRIVGTTQGGVSKAPDGRFRVSNIVGGSYMIKITAVGYRTVETKVDIIQGDTTTVLVSIEKGQSVTNIIIGDHPPLLINPERFGTTAIITAEELERMP
jgi:hypothetical protein